MTYKFQKPDGNQKQIVSDLQELGFQVDDVHGCRGLGYDIVVSWRGASLRVEIKNAGGTLTPAEKKYHAESKHQETLIIAYNTNDILRWFGRV